MVDYRLQPNKYPLLSIEDCRKAFFINVILIRDECKNALLVLLSIKRRCLWCKNCSKAFAEPIQEILKEHRITLNYKRGIAWASEKFSCLKKVIHYFRCSSGLLHKTVYEKFATKLKERSYLFYPHLG